MKELIKVWLVSKVIGEAISLIGILFCATVVGWLAFKVLPAAIGKVFWWGW
ncbi:hypothetical protein [Effusibacillus dendaii]|uniref:hypothetical protein n=1 Tax=Effusibacillus dendaii TaxID=2743772 RepID=UPI001909B0EA|nr:hypothetical protein [Effusibacillus dendaii]